MSSWIERPGARSGGAQCSATSTVRSSAGGLVGCGNGVRPWQNQMEPGSTVSKSTDDPAVFSSTPLAVPGPWFVTVIVTYLPFVV